MKIEWALLAEGLGQDARGALTAIGLSQNVLTVDKFPAKTKRAIIIHIVDLNPGDSLSLNLLLKDPRGRVLLAQSADTILGEVAFPELPAALDLPAEMVMSVNEPGTFQIEARIQDQHGDVAEVSVPLHVLHAVR